MPIDDYEQLHRPFEAHGMAFPVYFRGTGPGVILMHEILGMGPECVAPADRLAGEGYTVFLPLFFGIPGRDVTSPIEQAFAVARVCVMREFHCFANNESSPVTAWLRALSGEVHRRCGGPGVGAVGMCLTGGFVLSMMIEPAVVAPVACQPSLPLNPPGPDDGTWRTALGLSAEDLEAAKRRHADRVPLLALRYASDTICPRQRMDRLQQEFPGMHYVELPASRKQHATLTEDFSPEAYAQVATFLRECLLRPS